MFVVQSLAIMNIICFLFCPKHGYVLQTSHFSEWSQLSASIDVEVYLRTILTKKEPSWASTELVDLLIPPGTIEVALII